MADRIPGWENSRGFGMVEVCQVKTTDLASEASKKRLGLNT